MNRNSSKYDERKRNLLKRVINRIFDSQTDLGGNGEASYSGEVTIRENVEKAFNIEAKANESIPEKPGSSPSDDNESDSVQRNEPVVYSLPPLSLLNRHINEGSDFDTRYLRSSSQRLNEMLQDSRIDAWVVSVTAGPISVRYEVKLAPGAKANISTKTLCCFYL